jgi:hypothetical protein
MNSFMHSGQPDPHQIESLNETFAASARSNSPTEYKVNLFESRAIIDEQNSSGTKLVRPSPDSGLAISEGMSNSGSPHGQPPTTTMAGPSTSPIPGSNLVVRPQAARSPYEWMKRPNPLHNNRPPKEGEVIDGE